MGTLREKLYERLGNTHLTARCEAMLEALNSDVAKALEPTFDELNPPPEPRKEYRYHLGDAVYIGTQEYELLSFDEKKVVLFDTQFPLFNKELTREEFDNRLKENPLNDRLLQVVEELPVADNTKADQDVQEPEAVSDEELDALPISTVKDGEVVTYSNAEALLDDQEEALAPPPQVKKPSRIVPHVLHPEINTEYRTNFRIENDDIGVGTPLERFYHNIRAIQLLNKLNAENRLATPTEQRVLADYVGWGGLSEFFKEENPHYSELKNVLSDEEYASARESTLTAFYTPPVVIKAVYSALENMSFQTGNVLEPSCGVGNFMGLVPESMNGAKFYGVELDSVSGRIAQQLYQKNSIAVQGFENTNLPDSFFDAAIGNVPFGQFKVPDKRYDKDDVVTFEELGVDRIFIDEAHYYKNLAAFTKMRNVGGISQTEAMKSSDLYMKCRYLDELSGGRGVVFATGTPISNSMVEMYTMQKYLQYGALRRNDLLHFDAWASTFGETVTAIELSPEGYTLIGR